jgi:hypothetical protein
MTIVLLAAFVVLAGGSLAGLGAAAWQGWCDASARVTTCLNTIEPPDLSTEFDQYVDDALHLVGNDWDAAFRKELAP